MTFAWRVGAPPTRRLSTSLRVARTPAFAGSGVLCALNAQADQITNALTWQSPVEALTSLGGIAAVVWIAMYAALKLGLEDRQQALSASDGVILALIVSLSFLPVSYAAQAGLMVCSTFLFATSGSSNLARRTSLVLLALTGPLIWGRLLLQLFATRLLWTDAHLAALLAGTDVQGNVVQFAQASGGFLIGVRCSSVHNMSLAVVLWTTAAASFNLRVDRRYLGVGAAMVGLMFALNIVRLAVMAMYPEKFRFLHVGLGADLFGWTGLIGAALIVAWGVIDAAQRQR